MEELIEELTKVNPSNLSEEGLKLFNKINEIIDKNEQLEEKLQEAENQLDLDYVDNNYIPKSKVKEKLEELNKIDQQTLTDISYIAINSKIQVLKELL